MFKIISSIAPRWISAPSQRKSPDKLVTKIDLTANKNEIVNSNLTTKDDEIINVDSDLDVEHITKVEKNSNDGIDPPIVGELIDILSLSNDKESSGGKAKKTPEWERFDSTYHVFLSHDEDNHVGDEGRRGGDCTIRRIRQGSELPINTKWRLAQSRGQGSSRRRKSVATFSDEFNYKKAPKRPNISPAPKETAKKPRVTQNTENTTIRQKSQHHHFLERELKKSKDEILRSLPMYLKSEINSCCWARFRTKKNLPSMKSNNHLSYFPALIIDPFGLSDDALILYDWARMFVLATNAEEGKENWKFVVYWYETGYSTAKGNTNKNLKAFGLVNRSDIVKFEEGVRLGYDKRTDIMAKQKQGKGLSRTEGFLMHGIKTMIKDKRKVEWERGGPMFFQHLIDEEKEKSEKIAQEDQCQIVKRKKNQNASREARRDTKYSLELCSGEGRISSALKERGFKTVTLDNSNEKESDSSLSLEELETNIEDDTIFHDPLYTSTLGSDFDFIWAAPDCRTWSYAASPAYRSDEFINGFFGKPKYAEAKQAERDIESLINILLEYKSRNPDLLICIENPDAYLPKHPVSKGFTNELGLTMVTISYCRFGTNAQPLPRKHTVLWTNSKTLIYAFRGTRRRCTGNCGTIVDGEHASQVYDYPDRCAAYPPQLCEYIATEIDADVQEIKQERKSKWQAGGR